MGKQNGKIGSICSYRLLAPCEEKYKKREKQGKKAIRSGKERTPKYSDIYFRFLQAPLYFEKYWTESKYSQEGLRAAIMIKTKLKILAGIMYENLGLMR